MTPDNTKAQAPDPEKLDLAKLKAFMEVVACRKGAPVVSESDVIDAADCWADEIDRLAALSPAPSPQGANTRVSRMKALLIEVAETLSQNIVREDAKGKGWEIGAEMAVLVPWAELHLVFTYIRRLGIAIDEAPAPPLTDTPVPATLLERMAVYLEESECECDKSTGHVCDRCQLIKAIAAPLTATAPGPDEKSLRHLFHRVVMREGLNLDDRHHQNVIARVFDALKDAEKPAKPPAPAPDPKGGAQPPNEIFLSPDDDDQVLDEGWEGACWSPERLSEDSVRYIRAPTETPGTATPAGMPDAFLDGAAVIWTGVGGPVQQIAVSVDKVYGRWDSSALWTHLAYLNRTYPTPTARPSPPLPKGGA